MNELLSKSKDFKQEYCCTIVRIGEVLPIEGSDFLGQVMVEGRTIVVRKDQVKEGDVMFYVSNECQVNGDFLSINSFYEDRTMNNNSEQKHNVYICVHYESDKGYFYAERNDQRHFKKYFYPTFNEAIRGLIISGL